MMTVVFLGGLVIGTTFGMCLMGILVIGRGEERGLRVRPMPRIPRPPWDDDDWSRP